MKQRLYCALEGRALYVPHDDDVGNFLCHRVYLCVYLCASV